MAVRVVRLGTPRTSGEGLRLGTVRRPPRGVKKADFARRDYYDTWLPVLAPSPSLVSSAQSSDWTDARWVKFERDYRAEMRRPVPRELIVLLAKMSRRVNFSVGCYCEREDRCHRSILRKLFKEEGAKFA